jgi:hypothetical protein
MKAMKNPKTQKRIEILDTSLRILSALLVIAGVSLLTAVLFLVNREILELAAEEIMITGDAVKVIAVALLLLVVVSGLVSLYRLRYGWLVVFSTASLVLLMGLLMGAGTISLTMVSFIVMMVLSLLLWAAAVIHYFWDLYT